MQSNVAEGSFTKELDEREIGDWDICDIALTSPSPTTKVSSDDAVAKRLGITETKPITRKAILGFPSIDGRACGLISQESPHFRASSKRMGYELAIRQLSRETANSQTPFSKQQVQSSLQHFTQQCLSQPALPRSMRQAVLSAHSVNSTLQRATSGDSDAETMPYFVYGSSMFPAMIVRLQLDLFTAATTNKTSDGDSYRPSDNSRPCTTETQFRLSPAVLPGYLIHALEGKPYPACVPSKESSEPQQQLPPLAAGMLLQLPDSADSPALRERIHALQNRDYRLERVKILTAANAPVEGSEEGVTELEAVTYVFGGDATQLVARDLRLWEIGDLLRDEWFRGIIGNEHVQREEQMWTRGLEANQ